MVKIKSRAEISKNWEEAIGRVPSRYGEGVKGTTNWAERASSEEAENLWKEMIDKAASRKARQKAVSRVSNADWQRQASDLGSKRIGPGMRANAAKRADRFEPFRSAIEGVSLPARSADPMTNVDNRVKPIVDTLVKTKESVE